MKKTIKNITKIALGVVTSSLLLCSVSIISGSIISKNVNSLTTTPTEGPMSLSEAFCGTTGQTSFSLGISFTTTEAAQLSPVVLMGKLKTYMTSNDRLDNFKPNQLDIPADSIGKTTDNAKAVLNVKSWSTFYTTESGAGKNTIEFTYTITPLIDLSTNLITTKMENQTKWIAQPTEKEMLNEIKTWNNNGNLRLNQLEIKNMGNPIWSPDDTSYKQESELYNDGAYNVTVSVIANSNVYLPTSNPITIHYRLVRQDLNTLLPKDAGEFTVRPNAETIARQLCDENGQKYDTITRDGGVITATPIDGQNKANVSINKSPYYFVNDSFIRDFTCDEAQKSLKNDLFQSATPKLFGGNDNTVKFNQFPDREDIIDWFETQSDWEFANDLVWDEIDMTDITGDYGTGTVVWNGKQNSFVYNSSENDKVTLSFAYEITPLTILAQIE